MLGKIGGNVIMIAIPRNILDHFQRAFGVCIEQAINGHFTFCHFVEAREIEVAQFRSLIPFIKAEVVFIPRLRERVGDPRQILAQMRIAGNGEPAKSVEHIPRQRLKARVEGCEAFAEDRIKSSPVRLSRMERIHVK